ncbi:MAG: aryl-sulfate sulfotransferase [Bacteroidetes bacterium]|nr:aryl-sulfate sulfotransferase [Bacteroidota bacterium]
MKRNLFLVAVIALILSDFFGANAQQMDGYTLYSIQNSTGAVLIDTNGTTYHNWTNLSGGTGYSVYLRPGGNLIRTVMNSGNSFNGGGITGRVQEVDYNGNLVWDYVYSTTQYCMHHDICPMPNGNVLLISYELKTASEVLQAGASTSHVMWPDKIVEVQPNGLNGANIVWEWHVWDHLVQNIDSTRDNYQSSILDHPELLNINYQNSSNTKDWMHMNGIDYNPVLDQIVFSSHNLNQLFVIDHSTTTAEAATHTGGNSGHGGDFLYRWGNPASYGASGSQILNVVHDAHWIPQDCPRANELVAFNNNGISNNQSAVDFVIPPYDGYNYTYTAGTAYQPTSYSLRHTCNGHSSNMGSSEQLPNGNMLVAVATSGTIYEVDSNGTTLFSKTLSGNVPQAHHYSACYISGTMPATPNITQNGGTLTSDAGYQYQWYDNGVVITGATNQSYNPPHDGNYEVQIIDPNGCRSALSSPYIYITTGITNDEFSKSVTLFPNPSNGMIHIGGIAPENINLTTISDIHGKVVSESKNASQIDLSAVANGLYMVRIQTAGHVMIKKVNIVR